MALVGASQAPVLFLDDALVIRGISRSFCRTYAVGPVGVVGTELSDLGDGEWGGRQLKALLRATLAGTASLERYELDLVRLGQEPRNLVLNAQRIGEAGDVTAQLVLTAVDVTEVRAADKLKDELVREKGMLLQELQHRIANSLQIIASVLLQSARQVQSDESRTHLHNAHHRVMSIATLQKQLSASEPGYVALRPYFHDLCASLGASMIDDANRVVLTATVDSSNTSHDTSVSLGLVVTELVINALKHAFPEERSGKILVDYGSKGLDWTLSVADDGIGMPADAIKAKAGLGTSIVQALARQLDATISVSDNKPGTAISLDHVEAAQPAVRGAAL